MMAEMIQPDTPRGYTHGDRMEMGMEMEMGIGIEMVMVMREMAGWGWEQCRNS